MAKSQSGPVERVHHRAPPSAAAPRSVLPAPRTTLGDEARRLEGLLDEAVGQGDAVLAMRDLVKVPDIAPRVALAVEGEQAVRLGQRGTPRRGTLPSVIEQPVEAVVLLYGFHSPTRRASVSSTDA